VNLLSNTQRAFVLMLMLLSSGCALTPNAKPAAERFEINTPSASTPAPLPISEVSLRGPSWLETTQMGYRLRYAKASRREAYTLSRWVAPPAEMMLHALKRGLPQGAEGCRLRIELDEFVQDFSSAQESTARIEARARLMMPNGEAVNKRFEVLVPAGFADAEGGAQALNEASQKWIAEVRTWLAGEARTRPDACKPKAR